MYCTAKPLLAILCPTRFASFDFPTAGRPQICLNNVKSNILLPAGNMPPPLPSETPMNIEVAWRVVKERPEEVRSFVKTHLATIESLQFLTMRDVEDLLTMTGI